jgi:hypothetical protein
VQRFASPGPNASFGFLSITAHALYSVAFRIVSFLFFLVRPVRVCSGECQRCLGGCVTIAYDTIPCGPFSILRLRTFYLSILSAIMLPLFKIVKICNIAYFRKRLFIFYTIFINNIYNIIYKCLYNNYIQPNCIFPTNIWTEEPSINKRYHKYKKNLEVFLYNITLNFMF